MEITRKYIQGFGSLILMITPGINNLSAQNSEGRCKAESIQVGYGVVNIRQSELKRQSEKEYPLSFSKKGPFFIRYECLTRKNLSIGFSLAYAFARGRYTILEFNDSLMLQEFDRIEKWSSTSIMVRGNYFFYQSKKSMVYFGAGVGYRTWNHTYNSNDVPPSNLPFGGPLAFETTIGAKYMLVDNIGLYTEIGLAKALLQFGLVGRW